MSNYIKWDDVVARYDNVADVGGSTSIGSAYIVYAEVEVEGKLAPAYTLPFSSNNLAIKDLCIDTTFAKIIAYKDTTKSESIYEAVNKRIENLLSGKELMLTTSGDIIGRNGLGTIHSDTQDYRATFDMNDVENSWVDPDRQEDELNKRNT